MTVRINYHGCGSELCCHPKNPSDIGRPAHIRACHAAADTDNIIGSCDIAAGKTAQGCVAAADGIAIEGTITDGGVTAATCIRKERFKTVSRVIVTVTAHQCIKACRCVGLAIGICVERTGAIGCVVDPGVVGLECPTASGCILEAFGVACERRNTGGGIVEADRVVVQGGRADSRISGPGRVAK